MRPASRRLFLVLIVTASCQLAVTEELGAGQKVSYRGSQVVTVPLNYTSRLNDLLDTDDINYWGQNLVSADYFIKQEKLDPVKKFFEKENIAYEVVIEDVQRAIDEENPLSKDRVDVDRAGHRMDWDSYHRFGDIEKYLNHLAQTYPDFVTVETIGKSVEGRPLKCLKISSGKPNAKALWIDGGTHGREWITIATVTYIIKELTENRKSHSKDIEGIDIYFVPVMNPDGYEYTHMVARMWRKNRSKVPGLCTGTDLNRNWGYKWGGKGASKNSCDWTYGGSSAFSEPETRAASNFILTIPNLKGFVSFHSYGQIILYPFGYDINQPAPDKDDLDRVGRLMANAIAETDRKEYTVDTASVLYPASGGASDWAKGAANVKYAFTIELRDQGIHGFILPAQYILPTAKEALVAIKTLSSEIQKLP